MKKQTLIISLLIVILYSCQKEKPDTDVSPVVVDVYVAGFVSDDANYHYPSNPLYNSDEHPTYWKNGNLVQLNYDDSRPDDPKSGRAYSIAVSGNNVYAAGYQQWFSYFIGALPMGVFWKNGISMNRDSMNIWNTYELYSLAVSNNNTYMAGWGDYGNATYWKNENLTDLSLNAPDLSLATSIAISGNEVYVGGVSANRNYSNGGYNRMAKYWKNGEPVNLTDGSKDALVNFIAVSGTDVYVAGSEKNGSVWVAEYWKNGNLVKLTNGLTGADATAIAVSGTDVYVAGTQWDGDSIPYNEGFSTYQYNDGYSTYNHNAIAKYWKNGNPVNLTDGSKWAEARSIAVAGSDVYVAGFEDAVAKYWKNGVPVILGDVSKNSEAYSIFLAPK